MSASGSDFDSSAALMSDASGATLAPGAVLAALVALALGEGERSVLVWGGRHAPPTRTRVRRIARRRGTFTADGNRRRACASRRRGRRGGNAAARADVLPPGSRS